MTNETPKGKRTIRRTVAGSIVGYVAGKLWINFGDSFDPYAEGKAKEWVEEK